MKVSVIIPTLNAEKWIGKQLDCLISQTVQAEILVIDSDSRDRTAEIVKSRGNRIRFLTIPREKFDHGETRDYAVRQTDSEYVAFLTQDALPADDRWLEKMLKACSGPETAAVFGRQKAYSDAPAYEKVTREYNYPAEGYVWREKDVTPRGLRSFFFSNACSVYRRACYDAVGGFDRPAVSNEDMLMAAKLLHAGYALAYAPEAVVYHSHRHSLPEEYRRHFLSGYAMRKYETRLAGSGFGTEGMTLARFVCASLLRSGKPGSMFVFLIHAAARYLGHCAGDRAARKNRCDDDITPVKMSR